VTRMAGNRAKSLKGLSTVASVFDQETVVVTARQVIGSLYVTVLDRGGDTSHGLPLWEEESGGEWTLGLC
jgi:hypothetical protein